VNTDLLDEMLRVMETSDNSTLKYVTGEMKKYMDDQSLTEISHNGIIVFIFAQVSGPVYCINALV